MTTRTWTLKAAKIAACITALMTLVSMTAAPCFADDVQRGITKEETVYVITDSAGKTDDVIVSDHLKNTSHSAVIKDKTNLTDIENVKGYEKFKQSGSNLTWKADGADIYYQGHSDKEVPVNMNVKYFLDGEKISGKKLKGANGHLRIVIRYKSTAKSGVSTVPFIALTGFMVTDNCFTDIKVSSGKVLDDGDKQIVAAVACPGLSDTFSLPDNSISMSDKVVIEGTADNFAVEDMMTFATNNIFESIDSEEFGSLDFDDQISQLDNGARQLVDGSRQLYDGIHYLNSNTGTLADGIAKLAGGSETLEGGIGEFTYTVTDKMNTMKDGVQTMAGVSEKIYGGIGQLKEGADELASNTSEGSQLNLAVLGIRQYVEGACDALTGTDKAISLAEGASGNAASAASAASSIYGDTGSSTAALKAKISELTSAGKMSQEDAGELNSLIENIESAAGTAKACAEGSAQQAAGAAKYAQGAAGALKSGDPENPAATELLEGLKGGIGKINSGAELMSRNMGEKNESGVPVPGETLLYAAYGLMGGLDTLNAELGYSTQKGGTLSKGVKQLTSGAAKLADGLEQLNSKSGVLIGGIQKLDTGSFELSAGIVQLYREGISKIVSLYQDDLKGLVNGVDNLVNAGKAYKTFSPLPNNMDGNVKFVFKTAVTE